MLAKMRVDCCFEVVFHYLHDSGESKRLVMDCDGKLVDGTYLVVFLEHLGVPYRRC